MMLSGANTSAEIVRERVAGLIDEAGGRALRSASRCERLFLLVTSPERSFREA
jgi:hypothetical protein